jgi:hypothetical protein
MSVASTLDLESYRLLDSRLSQNQSTRSFQTSIGGSNVTYRKEHSNASSDTQVSFQLTPNSPNNVLDRTFMLTSVVTVDFKSNNIDDTKILNSGDNACRGFSSIVESTNVAINGLTISQETKYVKDLYNRFSDDLDNLVKFQSITPSLSTEGDNFTEYSTGYGTSQNVLAGYKDSNRRTTGRSFYPIEVIFNPIGDGDPGFPLVDAQIKFRMVELFTLSPLEYEGLMVPGLANVTSLQLNFNLSSDKTKFWSRAKTAGRVTETVFQVKPTFADYEIHFCEITLPVFYSLPPSIALSYYDVQRQVSRGTQFYNYLSTFDLNTNTYQLNQTPSRIMVLVRPPPNDSNAYQTDTFAAIESINIQYNNMSSILSSASTEQLFQISSRNGSTQHYTEFRGYTVNYDSVSQTPLGTTGSIICLDFGKDISADPTAIPGTSINANFSINVKGRYYGTAVNTPLEVHIFYIYAGVMVISPGSAFSYRSLLTRDETLSLPLLEGDGAGSSNLKGGAMKQFGNVGFNKAYKGAKDAMQGVKEGIHSATGGARAGMSAAGVNTSGRSTGLVGGQSKSKSALMDAFK